MATTLVHAHDLFIKLDTYFLEPNQDVEVRVRLDTTQWTPGVKTTLLRFGTREAGTGTA